MNNTCFINEIEEKNIASAHFKENDKYDFKKKISRSIW